MPFVFRVLKSNLKYLVIFYFFKVKFSDGHPNFLGQLVSLFGALYSTADAVFPFERAKELQVFLSEIGLLKGELEGASLAFVFSHEEEIVAKTVSVKLVFGKAALSPLHCLHQPLPVNKGQQVNAHPSESGTIYVKFEICGIEVNDF